MKLDAPSAAARRELALVAVVFAAVLGLAFHDVVVGGRTFSPAAWVPGVLPSGPLDAARPVAAAPVRDPEGGAWVDEPSSAIVHRSLAAGRLPLWNPGEGLGASLVGNPNSAAFAPLALPVNLWPSPLVRDLAWLWRLWVLAVGTFLLARELGIHGSGAALAGVAIALSGQSVDWIVHHPLHVDAFVPWALWGALRILGLGSSTSRGAGDAVRGALVLAAAGGAALLGVKPQSLLVSTLAGAIWLFARWMDRREPSSDGPSLGPRLPWLVIGAALACALASVVLLPALDSWQDASGLVREARRNQGQYRLPAAGLLGLLGPWAMRAWSGLPDAALESGLPHVGLVVLGLATAGAWATRRARTTQVLVATVVIGIAAAVVPLPRVISRLPVLDSVNLVKYCFPVYLALAVLAGAGFDWVRTSTGRRSAPAPRVRSVTVGCFLLVELAALAGRERALRRDPFAAPPWLEGLTRLTKDRPGRLIGPVELLPPLVSAAVGQRDLRSIDVLTSQATYDFTSLLVSPSQGLVWLTADPDPLLAATSPSSARADLRWILARGPLDRSALAAAVRSHASSRRLVRLLAGLRSLDVAAASRGAGLAVRGGDRRFHWSCAPPCRLDVSMSEFAGSLAVGFTAPEHTEVDVEVREEHAPCAGGELGSAGSESPTAAARQVPGPHARLDLGPDDQKWRDLFLEPGEAQGGRRSCSPRSFSVAIAGPADREVWIGGVGPSPGEAEEDREIRRELAARGRQLDRIVLRQADSVAHVYENPVAAGAAWLAARLVEVPNDDDVWRALAAADAEIEGEPATVLRASDYAALGRPAVGGGGTVRVLADVADRLDLSVEAHGGGLLVISRAFDPGWRASIDGVPATVVRADGALLALAIPDGAHRVELWWRSRAFVLGAGLSTAGAAVWLGLWLVPARRRRLVQGGGLEPAPGVG